MGRRYLPADTASGINDLWWGQHFWTLGMACRRNIWARHLWPSRIWTVFEGGGRKMWTGFVCLWILVTASWHGKPKLDCSHSAAVGKLRYSEWHNNTQREKVNCFMSYTENNPACVANYFKTWSCTVPRSGTYQQYVFSIDSWAALRSSLAFLGQSILILQVLQATTHCTDIFTAHSSAEGSCLNTDPPHWL